MSINFGGYDFTDPVYLSTWRAPSLPGLYVILTLDASSKPLPYKPLYFGETNNFATRGIGESHDKYFCWILQAGVKANLFVSIHITPLSSDIQRRAIEQQLIAAYRPPCND